MKLAILLLALLWVLPGHSYTITCDRILQYTSTDSAKVRKNRGDISKAEWTLFYKIAELPQITLEGLLSNRIAFKSQQPRHFQNAHVYELSVRRAEPMTQERNAAAHLSIQLGLPILLLTDFPAFGAVPAVDAVVFSKEGYPIANLSIKSVHSRFGSVSATRNALTSAKHKREDYYNRDFMINHFGFTAKENPELTIIPEAILKILGLEDDKRKRPFILAVDYLQIPSAKPVFNNEDIGQTMGIRVVDLPLSELRINLSSLLSRIREVEEIDSYYFLFPKVTVKLDKNRILKSTSF